MGITDIYIFSKTKNNNNLRVIYCALLDNIIINFISHTIQRSVSKKFKKIQSIYSPYNQVQI